MLQTRLFSWLEFLVKAEFQGSESQGCQGQVRKQPADTAAQGESRFRPKSSKRRPRGFVQFPGPNHMSPPFLGHLFRKLPVAPF